MKPSRNAVFAMIALFVAGLGAAGLASGAANSHTRRLPPRYTRIAPACAISVVMNSKTGVVMTPRTDAVTTAESVASSQPDPTPVPSKQLLAAFGVLRRAHADADKLPTDVVAALRARGASFDPQTARLLRTSPGGGKAWIVPVTDVHAVEVSPPCGPFYKLPAVRSRYRKLLPSPRSVPALPRTLKPLPFRVPRAALRARARSLRPLLRRLRAQKRALSMLQPRLAIPQAVAPQPAIAQGPEEGVVVVATGGAPAGGGGALDDLVRGRAAPEMRPCSGAGRDLTAVSGVVPDGVEQAFLTSPDGTAIKADVTDNGYSFLVAPLSTPAPRYVVWLKDGLPHVQPLPIFGGRMRCAGSSRAPDGIDVTPNGLSSFPAAIEMMPRIAAVPYAVPRMAIPAPTVTAVPPTPAPVPVPTTPAVPEKP